MGFLTADNIRILLFVIVGQWQGGPCILLKWFLFYGEQRYLIVQQLYFLVFSLSSHSWWSLNYALGISLPCILCSFLPLPIDAFHLKLNRFKLSLIVETVIVPCVFNVRPLIVVFMYEQGFFLGNAHCTHRPLQIEALPTKHNKFKLPNDS